MGCIRLVVALALASFTVFASGCSSEATGDGETESASEAIALRPEQAQLMFDKGSCLGCHSVDTRSIGPSFQAVAARYRTAPRRATIEQLVNKVHRGGTGKWGVIPMPPNPQVFKRDIEVMVTYVLDLPDPPHVASPADAGVDAD